VEAQVLAELAHPRQQLGAAHERNERSLDALARSGDELVGGGALRRIHALGRQRRQSIDR